MATQRGRTAAAARARAHYPVADLVQEDTTLAIRPKRKGRKGHPTQEPYEARESLLVLVATTLIYNAVAIERIMKRCQEPLDMRGATPEEMRQLTKTLQRMKRRIKDLDISCRS